MPIPPFRAIGAAGSAAYAAGTRSPSPSIWGLFPEVARALTARRALAPGRPPALFDSSRRFGESGSAPLGRRCR